MDRMGPSHILSLIHTVAIGTMLNNNDGNNGHGLENVRCKQTCRAIKTKGMVFRYTWVYSKEDTMAHTRRPMVTS